MGEKFNHWIVLEELGSKLKCQCDCEDHTIKIVDKYSVTHGKSQSCGCTQKFKELKPGARFGYWEVIADIDRKYALCRCVCGKEKKVQKSHLKNGSSLSCGCKKGIVQNNLEGQTIGYYTVLKELGGGKVIAQCICGNTKELYKNQLVNGRVKSCGCMSSKLKSKAFLKDMAGQTFNSWVIVKELGNGNVLARCSCGTERIIEKASIIDGRSKSCGHDTNKFKDLTNQTFYDWIVLAELGYGKVLCRCSCGTEKIIGKATLLSGKSKSCGCKQYINFRNVCLDRYGEITANRATNLRQLWQVEALQSREKLINIISTRFTEKPTIQDLSTLLNVNISSTGRVVKKYNLYDEIDFRPMRSQKEKDLYQWIKGLGLEVEAGNRKILSGKEIDIYIPSKKIGIEFNGTYWHSYPLKDKEYHQDKTLECAKKGIRLIHIFEYEWEDEEIQNKIKAYLRDLLVGTNVIYARNTEIKEVPVSDSILFQAENHLQGFSSASIHIGAYYNNELIGIMTFGKPRFNNEYQYEIIRMCFKSGVTVVGGAERMFKYFIKTYNPINVLTYSDISKFTGNIYLKLGFNVIQSKPLTEPNYIWINPIENIVLKRYQTQKKKLVDMGYSGFGSTEDEIMENLGYMKIYDCGSIRLEYINKGGI